MLSRGAAKLTGEPIHHFLQSILVHFPQVFCEFSDLFCDRLYCEATLSAIAL